MSTIRTRSRESLPEMYFSHEVVKHPVGGSQVHFVILYDEIGQEAHTTGEYTEESEAMEDARSWKEEHYPGHRLVPIGGEGDDWQEDNEMPPVRDHTAMERIRLEESASRIGGGLRSGEDDQ